jgi:hypothetical protein
MKASPSDWFDLIYKFYPRGLWADDPGYRETEEHLRLAEARRRAGAANGPWNALRDRLAERFPECGMLNRSVHLPTGSFDACYSGRLTLPLLEESQGEHAIGFLVSFLAPVYVVYSSLVFHSKDASGESRWTLPQIRFDFSADERPYAEVIAREIEATYGCERMPPEIGKVIVPDVAAGLRAPGEATIYDCLLSDDW